MKFVIWGAGFRAKRAVSIIGEKNIVAFIDSNLDKQGKKYFNVPIVSFEEYKKIYNAIPILISLQKYDKVVEILKCNGYDNYILLEELPSRYAEKINIIIDRIIEKENPNKTLAVYGINLFSIMLVEKMINSGFRSLYIINDKSRSLAKILLNYNTDLKIISASDSIDVDINKVLLASNDFYNVIKKYGKFRIDDIWNNYNEVLNAKDGLSKYSKIHSGKRMFIVATGPSLRIEDLDKLNQYKELSMSVNAVYKAFDKTRWRPDYFVITDYGFIKEYTQEIINVNIPVKFISEYDVSLEVYEKDKKTELFNIKTNNFSNPEEFSDDITQYIYCTYTVIYACIQIAIYMGVNEIYLLGADCNYDGITQNKSNHFIDNYFKENDSQPHHIFPQNDVFISYQVAKRYAERHGVKIYNATRGGKLEVFERVEFDSLFRDCIDIKNICPPPVD